MTPKEIMNLRFPKSQNHLSLSLLGSIELTAF